MRILVVEDDFVTRNVMTRLLTQLGQVDAAEDGVQAVDAFRKALAAGKPYDLITLDIMMPRMNGHEAMVAMRGLEAEQAFDQERRSRILVTTALDDIGNVTAAFRELCDDYAVKPIRKVTLFEKIEALGFPLPS